MLALRSLVHLQEPRCGFSRQVVALLKEEGCVQTHTHAHTHAHASTSTIRTNSCGSTHHNGPTSSTSAVKLPYCAAKF